MLLGEKKKESSSTQPHPNRVVKLHPSIRKEFKRANRLKTQSLVHMSMW